MENAKFANKQSSETNKVKTKEELKAEKEQRKAAFEAQRLKQLQAKSTSENDSSKSKAELRAERRAKQEAERSVKSQLKQDKTVKATNNIANEKTIVKLETPKKIHVVNDVYKISKPEIESTNLVKKGQTFAHLPQKHYDIEQLALEFSVDGIDVHPSVVQCGLRMNKGIITGSNERCVVMLMALKKVIQDYVTPPTKELSRDLQEVLCSHYVFLEKCRPLSVSMCNAIRPLKLAFSKIPPGKQDFQAKQDICKAIDDFITDEIICAQKGIVVNAMTKINDQDDVILVFGYSLIVKHVLQKAVKLGKKFSVVVVDSRPKFDGKTMLKSLLELNIPTTYIFINAISYVMKEVTKVLLGAHALLANGYVMSNLGSSQIALVANANNIPVLVCCETYKFSEKVHTDSFVHNELGSSNELMNPRTRNQTEQSNNYLNMLNLVYDVTPPEFVSVVITEIGALPCTSAPAVLRFRETK